MAAIEELQKDLQQVKAQFKAEISQEDGYLGKASGNDSFIHARLVLLTAKLGKYDFSRLKPAATAVELLDLALREHYQRWGRSPLSGASDQKEYTLEEKGPAGQISLIRGDHLFARALNLVATLGDCRVVRLLSQVIADVSEFQLLEVRPEHVVKNLASQFCKKVSLYVASSQVGALISELGLPTAKTLGEFSLNLGLYREALYRKQNVTVAARKTLHQLPKTDYRSLLENLLVIQGCHEKEVIKNSSK